MLMHVMLVASVRFQIIHTHKYINIFHFILAQCSSVISAIAYTNDHLLEPYTGIHLFILQLYFRK